MLPGSENVANAFANTTTGSMQTDKGLLRWVFCVCDDNRWERWKLKVFFYSSSSFSSRRAYILGVHTLKNIIIIMIGSEKSICFYTWKENCCWFWLGCEEKAADDQFEDNKATLEFSSHFLY